MKSTLHLVGGKERSKKLVQRKLFRIFEIHLISWSVEGATLREFADFSSNISIRKLVLGNFPHAKYYVCTSKRRFNLN